MPALSPSDGNSTRCQAERAPVGLVDVRRSPPLSPAMQRCEVGQETAVSSFGPEALRSIRTRFHARPARAGVVVLSTFPFESTVTQSDADGHEIAVSALST
jgi:hypothetical protein